MAKEVHEHEEREVHEHKEDLIRPGNEEYLSYYVKQFDSKPTKARGAIGATSRSPGPAIVYLPPTIGHEGHDQRKTREPAYKMGAKYSRQTFSCGPGPATFDTRKITNKGIDVCHAPKVGQKIEGLKPFLSPGPAAFHRGVSDKSVYMKMPAYTMRPKTEPLKRFITPAPGAFTLPETLGPGRSPFRRSAAYTMGGRLDKGGFQDENPGPAAYQLPPPSMTRSKSPAYSMGTKDEPSSFGTITPGPASNDYHMVKFHKPATPRFTFGIRHTPFEAFQHFAAEK